MAAMLCSAAAVQQALTVRDRRRYPPPGQLVDVDGHQMHLQVQGPDSGGPTVVLEAGMGSFSPNWYWVQQELSAMVRSVAYDRPGLAGVGRAAARAMLRRSPASSARLCARRISSLRT
jgi:pimeloyl-ACP methyl ester carboxylesterase